MEANEASQMLKKILKVERTDGDASSVMLSSQEDNLNKSSGEPQSSGHTYSAVNGSSSYVDGLLPMQQPARIKQQILLQGSDSKNSHVVYGQDVEIFASRASCISQPTTGSSKVKINPVVKYDWEQRRYIGNLIAVHLNRTHVAYVLRVSSSRNGNNYNVRVYNRKTAERTLLKGFNGCVVDIAFAFASSVVLGIVDEVGGIYVYDITETAEGKIVAQLRFQCSRPMYAASSDYHRLIWCPYIPDNTESTGSGSPVDDGSMMMMVTHDNIAEVWNVDIAAKSLEYTDVQLSSADARPGRKVIAEHVKPIVDGAFSPDGQHLASASLDGSVKFYEISQDDEPRCEQNWQPHDGQPLLCIFFLDDLKHQTSDKLWSFLVTGTTGRHELKIWSTQTWSCLQTVTLLVPPTALSSPLPGSAVIGQDSYLQLGVDLSASYLVLCDIARKVLYILQLHQDYEAGTAHVSSVSEFLLTQPVLSFALLDAGRRRLVKAEEYDAEHVWSCTTGEVAREEDEEDIPLNIHGPDIGVLVRLYAIHTKAMQEMQIRFQPESSATSVVPGSMSTTSETVSGIHDLLTDLSLQSTPTPGHSLASSAQQATDSSPASHSSPHPVLMTPNAFTSRLSDDTVNDMPSSISSSLTLVTAIDEDTDATPVNTPHSAKQAQSSVTDSAATDPVSLLPTIVSEMFPPSVRGVRSAGSFGDTAEDGVSDLISTDDDFTQVSPRVPQNSESSAGSSESAVELSEILDSAQRADDINVDSQLSPNLAYNDDDVVCYDDEDEQGQQDANGRLNPVRTGWSAEESPYEASNRDVRHVKNDFVVADQSEAGTQNHRQPAGTSVDSSHRPMFRETFEYNEMQRSLHQMVEMLQQQQQQIAELRSEMARQRAVSSNINQLSMRLDSMSSSITDRVAEVLQGQHQLDSDRWRQAVMTMESRGHQQTAQLEAKISQNINDVIHTQLEKIVDTEMKNVVLPHIVQLLDPVKEMMQTELARKLTSTDAVLKDSISKLVRSKQTMETLSQSTSAALQSSLQSVSRDILLPSFDRACQNMFQQVATVFQTGTREYVHNLESHLEQLRRRRDDARDPVLHQLRGAVEMLQQRELSHDSQQARLTTTVDTLQQTTAELTSTNDQLEAKILNKINERQDVLVDQLRQIVQREVTTALHSQQTTLTEHLEMALRSGAATPVPIASDPHQAQLQIGKLLHQGKINTAFQQALSAADLSLVLHVCRLMDPATVFSQSPCQLSQPVLLSLIQQLSANFDSDVELKHRYLEEALLQLDQSNPVTREHVATVMRQLCAKLSAYLQSSGPTDRLQRPMSKLLSVCELYLRACSR